MKDIYTRLFSTLSEPATPPDLLVRILSSIQAARIRAARLRLVYLSPITLLSAALSFPAFRFVAQEWFASGIPQYLTLVSTDSSVIAFTWQSFALSVVESLPIVAIIALLSVGFVFIASTAIVASSARTIFARPSLSPLSRI